MQTVPRSDKRENIYFIKDTALKLAESINISFELAVLAVVNKYFPQSDFTLDEIGKIFKVSRERCRQIEKQALKKMTTPQNTRQYRKYENME